MEIEFTPISQEEIDHLAVPRRGRPSAYAVLVDVAAQHPGTWYAFRGPTKNPIQGFSACARYHGLVVQGRTLKDGRHAVRIKPS